MDVRSLITAVYCQLQLSTSSNVLRRCIAKTYAFDVTLLMYLSRSSFPSAESHAKLAAPDGFSLTANGRDLKLMLLDSNDIMVCRHPCLSDASNFKPLISKTPKTVYYVPKCEGCFEGFRPHMDSIRMLAAVRFAPLACTTDIAWVRKLGSPCFHCFKIRHGRTQSIVTASRSTITKWCTGV